MARSPGKPTWTRGAPRCSPASSPALAVCTKSARAARSAPPPAAAPRPPDLLLDGLAVVVTGGRAQAAPLLRRAARVFAEGEITVEEGLR